uniref:Nuclear pore glycoprotein p62 n=1 Tax=Triatoma infestans TaxID=30076 RepID=A0A170ZBP7_TRIIF
MKKRHCSNNLMKILLVI